MDNAYTWEEIEAYLSGTLTEEQRHAFNAALETDAALRDAVEKHRDAHALVEQYAIARLTEKVKTLHQHEKSKTATPPYGGWLKIAASLLLLLVAGGYIYLDKKYAADSLYTESFAPYPNRFNTRGAAVDDLFAQAMNDYDNGAYAPAIEKFSSIDAPGDYTMPAKLYAGISWLALEQPGAALELLLPLGNGHSPYAEAARWYVALAYLKNNDEANAAAWLERIVQSNGYQSQQAGALLARLNSVWKKLPGI